MPIYEYHCNACGADFEMLVYGSKSEIACDKCSSTKTEKRMSRFGMGKSSSGSSGAGSSGCGGCTASSCSGCG